MEGSDRTAVYLAMIFSATSVKVVQCVRLIHVVNLLVPLVSACQDIREIVVIQVLMTLKSQLKINILYIYFSF
jgi:hypothetical protein